MLMDAKKLSELIRMKKKKLLESEPEVGSSEPATMNAQDVEDTKQRGRIEATLDVPEKINADDTVAEMSKEEAETAGLTPEEKTRMGRLRSFFDKMDLGW